MDAAVPTVPRPYYYIIVIRRLHTNHLGDKLWMMAKIGIHNDNEVASGEFD